jgi:cation diffusion facilitator CzcD-associated flavoprotein CzcO
MQFDTTVERLIWNAEERRWFFETNRGDEVQATYAVMATGGYHTWIEPDIPRLATFKGELYYTNHWPHEEVSFAGKRVGVIGTGSSGVQTAKAVANEPIESLHVFQRSAPYIVPSRDEPLDPEFVREFKRTYRERRARACRTGIEVVSSVGGGATADLPDEEFQRRAELMWEIGGLTSLTIFPDFAVDEAANNRVAEFIRTKIRETVEDPKLAELLSARGYFLGAKRIVIVDRYFEIYNKQNVHLIDIKTSPIRHLTEDAVVTADGEYPLDVLILATGFDSATGSMLAIDITGEDGKSLRETWANGHHTYLGIGIPGFPNLFMIAQAGSPGIRSHVMVSVEQHVEWIGAFLEYLRENEIVATQPTDEAAAKWTRHVADVALRTLLTVDDTHHLGTNVPGKPRVVTSYLGSVGMYRDTCDSVTKAGYPGWVFAREGGSTIAHNLTWERHTEDARADDTVRLPAPG